MIKQQENNFFGLIIALFFIVVMFLYFVLNSSYHLSIQAKYYYMNGDYENAYLYADKAWSQEKYNLMAFSVRQQSLISMEITEYIKQAKEYFKKIDTISRQKYLNDVDKVRIKVYADIIVESYDDLFWTRLTNKELLEEALLLKGEFSKLLKNLEEDDVRIY